MVISFATLETSIYTAFYTHFTTSSYSLVTAGNLTNNNQVTPVFSDNIVAKYGFPIIEIGKPVISNVDMERFGEYIKCDCMVPITVCEDNSVDSKTTTDAVRNKLITGRSTLKGQGVYKMKLIDGSNREVNKNKKNYHFTSISVNFEYREKI